MCFGGEVQVLGDQLRIVERQLVVDQPAAEGDLDAVEAELRGERDGFGIGAEAQIPIGDADAECGRGGPGKAGGSGGERAARGG